MSALCPKADIPPALKAASGHLFDDHQALGQRLLAATAHSPCRTVLAATNKSLAKMNKSCTGAKQLRSRTA
jgi:hypothetical protein